MEFQKKMKTRLWLSIAYLVIGVAIVVISNFTGRDDFLYTFGIGLAVCGLVRLRRYRMITRDEESLRKQEIAESDERNIYISGKAKSMAFNWYVLLSGVVIIVLQFMGKTEAVQMLGFSVCALVFLYWLCYFIFRKKS